MICDYKRMTLKYKMYICSINKRKKMKRNYVKYTSGAILTGLILFTSCQSTREVQANYEVAQIEGTRICMDSTWDAHPDEKAAILLKPYKEKIDKMMYEVIGVNEMTMDKGRPESLLSNLVAEVLRLSAERVLKHPADIGIMNMGGLRNILPQGDITVDAVFEILPFENSLCLLTMKGTEIKRLMEVIASLHGEGLSGAHLEITEDGKLLKATVQGKEIEDDKDYTVATIDYLADGNDGLTPFINADKRECPDGLTLRGLFLDYVRQQTAAGKKITSKLDGRITVVPASDRK